MTKSLKLYSAFSLEFLNGYISRGCLDKGATKELHFFLCVVNSMVSRFCIKDYNVKTLPLHVL